MRSAGLSILVETKSTHRQKQAVILKLGFVQTLGYGSTYYLPAILAQSIAKDLLISPSYVFAALSLSLVIAALVAKRIGYCIDLYGGRSVLIASGVLFSMGLALLALAQSPWGLFLAWIVIGIGMAGGLYESAFSTLVQLYGDDARGSITGITLIAGFASTISWPLSAWMEAELGWRSACLVWALLHISIGIPLLLSLPKNRLVFADPKPHSCDAEGSDQKIRVIKKEALLLGAVFAISWFVSTAIAAHLPRLLQHFSGLSLAGALAIATLMGPAQVVARLLELMLHKKVASLTCARLAMTCHPIGVCLLFMGAAPFAILFTLLHGMGNGMMTIAKGTLPLVIFGQSGYGQRLSQLSIASRLGQAIAPFLFGLLFDFSPDVAVLFSASLVSIGWFLLLQLKARY